jgi:hypothetical protein
MTRARDYTVFALSGLRPTGWLEILSDDGGLPLVGMPPADGSDILVGSNKRFPARVQEFTPVEVTASIRADAYAPSPAKRVVHPPFRVLPSVEGTISSTAVAYQKIDLGGRLALSGNADIRTLGEAVHRFLAADQGPSASTESRLELATAILSRWGISALSSDEMVLASERLHTYIGERWPNGSILREVPVTGRRGLQRVSGRIDLMVKTDGGLVIFDHKSFPGAEKDWATRLGSYHSQLATYSKLACGASGCGVAGLFVYLPVVGALLDLTDAVGISADPPTG